MKKLVIIFMAMLLCACARQGAMTPPEKGMEAKQWTAFEEREKAARPYRVQFSLRFGEEGNTRRITGILWGNDDQDLRMDVMAGVGAVIAKIYDNGDHFLLYAPRENRAYFHNGANKPLLKIGVPLPFGISSLAALLNGQYTRVFGHSYSDARFLDNGNAAYALDGGPGGTLEIDSGGLPVAWRQDNGEWIMDIAYDEGQTVPHSLKLASKNGKKAILLVKDRENPETPFTESQMSLAIPPQVKQLPLSKYKPS